MRGRVYRRKVAWEQTQAASPGMSNTQQTEDVLQYKSGGNEIHSHRVNLPLSLLRVHFVLQQ